MFLWGTLVFRLQLFQHLGGFLIMALSTSLATSAFGLLLASICRTRAQLGAMSTLVVLSLSVIGGSMFPRFLMPGRLAESRSGALQLMGNRRLHERLLARLAVVVDRIARRGTGRLGNRVLRRLKAIDETVGDCLGMRSVD